MTISAIVLAAGEGTRMRSARPKPLHTICGRAMILHVIDALERLRPARTALVVGHGADLDDDSTIVVLPGDTPLLQPETIEELVATHVASGSAATLLTSVVDDP